MRSMRYDSVNENPIRYDFLKVTLFVSSKKVRFCWWNWIFYSTQKKNSSKMTFYHNHKKRKNNLETLVPFSWNICLELLGWSEWLFVNFFQNGKHRWRFSLRRWFWCNCNENWQLDMLDNDNIIILIKFNIYF